MSNDLSARHQLVSDLFRPDDQADWNSLRLTGDQITFYRENGYLAGVRLLTDEQVEALKAEIDELTDPHHPGRHLFYEYNSKNLRTQTQFSFMRWVPGEFKQVCTMPCGIPDSSCQPRSYSMDQCDSGTIRFSISRHTTAALLRGIRTIRIGPEQSQWLIFLVGLD